MNSRSIVFLVAVIVLPLASYASDKADNSTNNRSAPSASCANLAAEPANQGISQTDLMTTRDINREIAHFSPLSPQARDVRVATYKGRVTLRGIVASAEEKRQVEKIAHQVAGNEAVVNEIEIGTNLARN